MKNTLIPLDLIWINSKKEIVYIKNNALPCNETCQPIVPNGKAKYVLEINTGIADKIGLKTGEKVDFK